MDTLHGQIQKGKRNLRGGGGAGYPVGQQERNTYSRENVGKE